MAILNDIEVRIASRTTGKVLKEYEKPYTVQSAEKLFIEKFIEAETGLEFHVEVFVNSKFQYYQASGILFGVHIDGDRVATYRYTSKEVLRQQVIDREPTVIDDVPHKEGDRSCRIKFNFGSLGISELLRNIDVDGTKASHRRRA